MARTAKAKCTCRPRQRGCAHFGSGKCRLKARWEDNKCEMTAGDYHYKCCPFLNSSLGREALQDCEYLREGPPDQTGHNYKICKQHRIFKSRPGWVYCVAKKQYIGEIKLLRDDIRGKNDPNDICNQCDITMTKEAK